MTKFRLVLDVVDAETAIEHYESFEGVSASVTVNLTLNQHTDTVILTGPYESLIEIARCHYDQEGHEFADSQVKPFGLTKFASQAHAI